MSLVAVVEDIESVDESVRGFYVEDNGVFRLDVEPVNGFALENVDGLKSALTKERGAVKDLTKKVTKYEKDFEGIDLEEYQTVKTKYEEWSKIDPVAKADELAEEKAKEKISKKQKEWQKQFETEVNGRESRIQELTKQLHGVMINGAAVKALADNGAGDSIDLLLPHVLKSTRLAEDNGKVIVEVVDEDGNPRVRSDGRNMTIDDLIPEMKTKWPNAFVAKVKSGGGSQPSKPAASSEKSADEMSTIELYRLGLQQKFAKK
jgi:hypothetical protein